MSQRYVKKGGKYWGNDYAELCRGHRIYVWSPRLGPNEEADLLVSPEGERVPAPPPVTECPMCLSSANRHGHGIHSVGIYGCPNCGGEVERKQSRGPHSVLNYTRCYECAPPFPVLLWPWRAAKRVWRWAHG